VVIGEVEVHRAIVHRSATGRPSAALYESRRP
jgi:hypothetical protein